MYVRTVKSGGRTYLRLVESYRDKQSGKVRQRTISNLFRLDGDNDEKIMAVKKWLEMDHESEKKVEFGDSKDFGDVFILHQIWHGLGLDKPFEVALKSKSPGISKAISLIRLMVFHRICDPGSKLKCLKWLEKADVPNAPHNVTHNRLLDAMDVLIRNLDRIETELAKLLKPLLDKDMTLAIYDLTTVGVCGETELRNDVRKFGKSKDFNGTARQFVLGMVQTEEGLPLMHQVHDGNVAETSTLQGMVQTLLKKYSIRRIVSVADRGLLSQKNVKELVALASEEGRDLQFILGIPARRYKKLKETMEKLEFKADGCHEGEFMDNRLVIVFNSKIAREQSERRLKDIRKLEELGKEFKTELEVLKQEVRKRGRPPDRNKRIRKFNSLARAKGLKDIVRLNTDDNAFEVAVDECERKKAEKFDGKMAMVTNVLDMPAEKISDYYWKRADIERGFRTMKSELLIAPVYHRLEYRIRAHAAICFLALLLNRVMRSRIRKNGGLQSPENIIATMNLLKKMTVNVNGREHVGLSNISEEQLNMFDLLEVEGPKGKIMKG